MAAQKPRTGDGLRLPVEGGGRLVIEISQDEAQDLKDVLAGALEG